MQMNVSQIRVGDYVSDVGVVSKIKYFYRREAVRGRTLNPAKRGLDRLDYARLVEEQQEGSYSEVLDSVVVYASGNVFRTFSADSVVNAIRISKAA